MRSAEELQQRSGNHSYICRRGDGTAKAGKGDFRRRLPESEAAEPRAWRRGAGGEADSEQGGAHAQAKREAARANVLT